MAALPDYEKLGVFYLGRRYDLKAKKPTEAQILFASKHLVTHGLILGMTGSGKTGLCFDILEEAAIDSIPAIVIDPKGDLSNLLLTFPDLKGDDFKPWVNAEDATKVDMTVDQFAAKQAETWKKGLADWGQDGDRIKRLREAADFTVYTPGSGAGLQVSVLKSFDRPPVEILEDAELLRERVSTTVSSLLQLVGVDADPVKSRETVFLANIMQNAWAKGRDLDLGQLIAEVQNPSIKKVGVLDIDSFFPAKARVELAMQLNNLLASPSFAAWMEGDPLDVGKFLHTPEGKPRVAIFSIAHLGDAERMFFVTMLLNNVLGWMRSQSGTNSLRALLYMDEIFGYFPPVANPPSKLPLLTLLKQARAFGLGVVLATQNPVDLDYKGLSNIGTWFIGRLQTDRDKKRVLDGLEGASSDQGGKFDRAAMEQLLAALGNRVFLLHSVHDDEQVVFQSRWAMSYMRGPLSRTQIKTLMADRKAAVEEAAPAAAAVDDSDVPMAAKVNARPVLPAEVPQVFAPAKGNASGVTYQPRLLGCAQVRYADKKAKIDIAKDVVTIVEITEEAIPVNWDAAEEVELAFDDFAKEVPEGDFLETAGPATNAKNYAKWAKEFSGWVFGNQRLTIYKSAVLGETSTADEDERAFRIRIQQTAREARDAAIEELKAKYGTKIGAQEERVRKAEASKQREEQQSQTSVLGNVVSFGSTILGSMFGSGKVISAGTIGKATTAIKGVTKTMQQSGDVARAAENLEAEKEKLARLEEALQGEIDELTGQFDVAKEQFETVDIKPTKTNITVRLVGLAWLPYAPDAAGMLKPAF